MNGTLIERLLEPCVDFTGEQIVDDSTPRYEIHCGLLREAADALRWRQTSGARFPVRCPSNSYHPDLPEENMEDDLMPVAWQWSDFSGKWYTVDTASMPIKDQEAIAGQCAEDHDGRVRALVPDTALSTAIRERDDARAEARAYYKDIEEAEARAAKARADAIEAQGRIADYDPTTQPFDEPLRHVDAPSAPPVELVARLRTPHTLDIRDIVQVRALLDIVGQERAEAADLIDALSAITGEE